MREKEYEKEEKEYEKEIKNGLKEVSFPNLRDGKRLPLIPVVKKLKEKLKDKKERKILEQRNARIIARNIQLRNKNKTKVKENMEQRKKQLLMQNHSVNYL